MAGDDCDFVIHSEGVYCKKIIVSVSQGEIKEGDVDCSYTLKPAKPGQVVFTFSLKTDTGMRVIGEQSFVVRRYPTPPITLGVFQTDTIEAAKVRIQLGPWVYPYSCFGPRYPPFRVYKYKVLIIRAGEVVFERDHYDAKRQQVFFDKPTQEFMKTFRAGDVILIKNIVAYGAGANYTDIKDIRIVGD